MKRSVLLLFLLIFCSLSLIGQTGLKAFLPLETEMPGWKMHDNVEEFEGDDLFFLINGGADLFLEFGFVEVMKASLKSDENENLYFEIYRMKDMFASYGIFLQKIAGMKERYSAGKDSYINESSLVLWKHHYFAIIRSDHASDSVTVGMKLLADIVDSRIKPRGKWPSIINDLNNKPGKVTLLRGKIALQNVYYFTSKDVFRIEEGIAFENPGVTDIHLKYRDSDTSVQRFGEVAGVLNREKRFSEFRMDGDIAFRMRDNKGNDIRIEANDNMLSIRIMKNSTPADSDFF